MMMEDDRREMRESNTVKNDDEELRKGRDEKRPRESTPGCEDLLPREKSVKWHQG